MAYFNIDIPLDDIDTKDLIEELRNRSLDDREKKWLLEMLKSDYWESDANKWELFLKTKDRFSMIELEAMLKENFHTDTPKEQILLPL